ncbi:hypothetical protein ACWD5R_24530 [Streptomyces sp. NPDC002514]|uniref:hypothetical protein n=1 Tax=unclassified Streptomyces TaxID=2593676 RepID=UPI00369B8513
MSVRRRSGGVVLGLLVALATLLGVACLCSHGHAIQAEPVAVVSVTHDSPVGHVREHACLSPGHEQCGAKPAVDTPTTGPGPQPHPLGVPVQVEFRPVLALTVTARYEAAPRAPDLHVLQVLRT